MDQVEDKNPKNFKGVTPLHEAALVGSEKICEMILEVVENKNPEDEKGITPLHQAAYKGQAWSIPQTVQKIRDL